MRRSIVVLGILLMALGSVSAQTSKLKRAHKAFYDLNYQEAIELYSQILEKQDNSKAKINLAESFRKVSNTQEAEYWYGQIVNLPESESVHKLYYGQMLQTNGKCDMAREWFSKYVDEVPDDLRGQYLVRACDYEDELMTKNEGVFDIEHMPFNTNLDDFSPMMYGEGIVFSSEYQSAGTSIKRSHSWTGKPFLELFYVDRNKVRSRKKEYNYEYGKTAKFSNRLNSKFHDAAVTFNSDETEIYFTRNNYYDGKTGKDDDGDIRLKIFSATNNGTSAWSGIEGLPFNSDEYSVAHPALSPDGTKLYFSSDMPGGFGGMDIYYTEMDNGRWGPPNNLGPNVNTEGHEVFPYASKDNKLYFASNGLVGLGGLDIYYMEIKNDRTFGEIINLGHPMNSTSDDFGIVMHDNGKFGYFSSDREGGLGGDDIYSFVKMAAPVRLFVYDSETGQGISDATIVNEGTGATYQTNGAGLVEFDQKMEVCHNYAVTADSYLDNAKEGCTKNLKKGEAVIVEIPLVKPLEFDIEGFVFNEESQAPLAGATVKLIPTGCDIEPQTTTADKNGAYYFKLEKDCCYKISTTIGSDYVKVTSKERCTKGLSSSTTLEQDMAMKPITPPATIIASNTPKNSNTPVAGKKQGAGTSVISNTTGDLSVTSNVVTDGPITTLDAFGEGRTPGTYLIHIYYDFDQSYIRDDAFDELQKLYSFLTDNPNYVVEVGSHTDSRGSESYNYRLSQRRAESVVRWLKEKGINANRMKPKGYGETINVNNCSNNVPCSEEEHQWNRRTEFKILGHLNGEGKHKNVVKSAKPSDINVNSCQGCPF